jgi:hypothetical protein
MPPFVSRNKMERCTRSRQNLPGNSMQFASDLRCRSLRLFGLWTKQFGSSRRDDNDDAIAVFLAMMAC